MERIPRVLLTLTTLPTLLAGTLTLGYSAPALADGPGVGTPVIVSMGDSTVSGEAGRWAGNTTTLDSSSVDALGDHAYWDTATGESVPGCHRSLSAEVHIGVDAAGHPVHSYNLACSGAETKTWDRWFGDFKPGLDNYVNIDRTNGESQSVLLAEYAQTHNVKAIVVRVGANDVNEGGIVKTCMEDWLAWMTGTDGYNLCSHDPTVTAAFTPQGQAELKHRIFTALSTIAADMYDVGYTQNMYSVIVETYWSPIPPANLIRYPENSMARQTAGGCGIFDADANWMNNTMLPALNTALRGAAAQFAQEPWYPPVHVLDEQYVLNGHRLCEKGANLLENIPDTNPNRRWSDPGAMYDLEWVQQLKTVTSAGTSYDPKEGGHADYFGQLAERDCLRQEYNNGTPVDATCVLGSGFGGSPPTWPGNGSPVGGSTSPGTVWHSPPVTHRPGEPVMTLQPLAPQAAPQ